MAALAVKPVEGVNAGRIDNIELVSRAVKEAVADVEEQLGIRITEAYAGISGEFVRCARHTDHVFVYDPQNGVSRRDVDALSTGCATCRHPTTRPSWSACPRTTWWTMRRR